MGAIIVCPPGKLQREISEPAITIMDLPANHAPAKGSSQAASLMLPAGAAQTVRWMMIQSERAY